jgi:hypothetical protein
VIDQIRSLLDRPLDSRPARAIVALACCVTFALAALVGFAMLGGSPSAERPPQGQRFTRPTAPPQAAPARQPRSSAEGPHRSVSRAKPRQDPQDRRGSSAYRRAHRTLSGSRALQHLPLRRGDLSITLIGADHGRAVLRVRASSVAKAKKGWRRVLRRFHDSGRAYELRFATRARGRVLESRDSHAQGSRGRAVVSVVASPVASPVAIDSSPNAANRHHTADPRLPILPTSLPYIEVVT